MTWLFPGFMVVCAVLVLAGAAKVRSPGVAGRVLGLAEVAIGTGAAVRPTPVTAAVVALAYATFCAFVVFARPARCGCFGTTDTDGGPAHVVLDAAACAVALLAALAPPAGIAAIGRHGPGIAVPLALGILAATFAAYLAFTTLPAAWRAYGAERW